MNPKNLLLRERNVWDNVEGASITVVGLGKSGISAANALASRGADVLAVDDKRDEELQSARKQLDKRVQLQCGPEQKGRRGDIFVISPGIGPTTRRYREILGLACQVISEIELFYRLDRASLGGMGHPIVAISGTDGKTTTTLLVAHLLKTAGYCVVVGGNIGEPLCDFLPQLQDDTVVVAEVSAFQLLTCQAFAPKVAVVTNIADDHLDYFDNDKAAYIATKLKVATHMKAGDFLAINADDPELEPARLALQRGARHAWAPFSTQGQPERGLGLWNGHLWAQASQGQSIDLFDFSLFGSRGKHPITGVHNAENALGAVAMAIHLGVTLAQIQQGLETFSLPSHRIEPVGTIGNVRFFDDSKATNPHAAIAGLRAMQLAQGEQLIWIGGGSEKDSDFSELGQVVASTASAALLIGQTAERIAACLPQGFNTYRCAKLEDCIPLGLELAPSGGVVLLSPACASYDMFQSYAHRGDVFAEAVARMAQALR